MSTSNHAPAFLKFYTETILKDIEQLKSIAEEGEKEYNDNLPSPPAQDPRYPPTTVKPPATYLEHQIEVQPSRCTIPLAMLCLSVAEGIGRLLDPTKTNFIDRVRLSFDYSGLTISHAERDILRGLYRNGVMHTFLPKGHLGISYDSTLKAKKQLFIKWSVDKLILNVTYLCEIVEAILKKIVSDTAIHGTIEQNLTAIMNNEEVEIATLIATYGGSLH